MKIVVIEDEQIAAEDICQCIKDARPDYEIVQILGAVSESIKFFSDEPDVDLIFSDIQLSDGSCFEIFEQTEIKSPVIFCTAYNTFALEAFKANGIDYILKPFDYLAIAKALQKYESLTGNKRQKLDALIQDINGEVKDKTHKILVYKKDKIIPINLNEVAVFYLKGSLLMLLTIAGDVYYTNRKLDELERITGTEFFRANRQTLINRKAIKNLSQLLNRKTKVNLNISSTIEIIVSKEKSKELIAWILDS